MTMTACVVQVIVLRRVVCFVWRPVTDVRKWPRVLSVMERLTMEMPVLVVRAIVRRPRGSFAN